VKVTEIDDIYTKLIRMRKIIC